MDKPADPSAIVRLDMAILAHNEARDLPKLLADLTRQTLFSDPAVDIRVHVLANGCTDDTVAVAEAAIVAMPEALGDRFAVVDRSQPGKSRTMNWFLGNALRADADLVMFVDGDIRLPVEGSMARMVAEMRTRPELLVFTSRPVKDIVHENLPVGPVARLIGAGREGLTDHRRSIAGSLFVLRGAFARRLAIPAGLPVEDGFVRAMILTEFLSQPEDFSRIDGDPEVFHIYESVRTLGALLRHQTRLVIGNAVNAALYRRIRQTAPDAGAAERLLKEAAEDEGWVARTLSEELPRAPYGYVPFRFATKRISALRGKGRASARALVMLLPGLLLDGIVYVRASLHMALRPSAGHW